MKKFYHITKYKNLESISENGLVPKQGSRTRLIGDKRTGIFLSYGIDNSILMYVSLLYYYNSYAGKKGLDAIKFYKDKLRMYRKEEKRIPLDEEDKKEIEAIIERIEHINQIIKYKSFSEYIGDGVYLSVSNIDKINKTDLKDCYTEEIISPENINVVVLKNKNTGEIVDNKEDVLTYFMNLISMEDIISDIHNVVTKKCVEDLYNSRINELNYYNSDNFDIEEIPISLYVNQRNKENEIIKNNL